MCVWYDGRGLSKEPRERGFLLSALFFFVSFSLDEGSNSEIRAAPTGQVCYALEARTHVAHTHGERQRGREKVTTKNVKPSEGAEEESLVLSTEMGEKEQMNEKGENSFFEKRGNKTCGGRAESKTECENAESSSHKTNPLSLCQEDETQRRSVLFHQNVR